MKNKDIIAFFSPKGLTLEVQETSGKAYFNDALLSNYKSEPYRTLFYKMRDFAKYLREENKRGALRKVPCWRDPGYSTTKRRDIICSAG